MKIKTIDVYAKEWFDKINGNSYFSANVIINYGMEDQENFVIPFTYGYDDQYVYIAFEELIKRGYISPKGEENHYYPYWQYYKDHNIITRHYKQENCKKRELSEV